MSRLGCRRAFEVSIVSASRAARFGQIIRARRRELDLTQEEVAKRIKVSQSLVQLLESGKRSPRPEVIQPLAEVLGFDARLLFFLARPNARAIFSSSLMARKPGVLNFLYYKRTKFPANPVLSARRRFKHDHLLRRFHDISDAEMEMLSRVASLGEVRSAREFLYVLNAVRQVIGTAIEGALCW